MSRAFMMCSSSVGAAIALLATPVGARAADAPAKEGQAVAVEEVIVTAQRRAENLQKVPISITAIGAERARALQTSGDLGQFVPNLQVEQTSGFGLNRTGIRGIAQGDFNGGSTTSNMVYLDDQPMNAIYAQGVPLWDIARVEVLRGPQGTLFGRNATGGAIRYISQTPGATEDGYAEATYGNSNEREFRAAVGGPVADAIRARVSVISHRRDGDVYNVILDRKENAEDYYGGRLVIQWDVTDSFKAMLKAQYFDSNVGTVGWKSTPGLATNDALGTTLNGFHNIGEVQASYGFKNLGPSSNYKLIESDGDNTEHLRHIPVELNLDWDLGFATLTSVSGFLDVKMLGQYDSDSSPAPIVNVYEQFKLRQLSQELRLTSNGDGPFKWIAGAFYMSESNSDRLSADATGRWKNSAFPKANAVFYQRQMVQKLETYAPFLHTTYQVTPKLMLTAAARYTYEKKDAVYIFRSIYDFPTTVGATSFEYTDFKKAVESGSYGALLRQASPAWDRGSDHFGELTWKLAADYQITDRIMAYALVTRGFKGGSFKPTANNRSDLGDPSLPIKAIRPEIVVDYEAGAKSTFWDGRARVNGAVYYYDYTDYQTNQLVGGEQTFTNLPEAKLYGAELELDLVPAEHLNVSLGLGYTHSKITKVLDPANPDNAALIGNKLPLAEDFNANGVISYDLVTSLGKFTPELSFKHYGKFYIDKENSRAIGNFTIYNAQIGYESPNAKYYGSLWIKNIADTVRPITVDDFSESFGSDQTYVNQRRRFGVTVGARL
jgi:iron complex outermembrane receptor protein